MSLFWTADEHYGHTNIIRFCDRPFENVVEMNNALISNHNKVVTKKDIVIHVGDFTLSHKEYAWRVIELLKGKHIFLYGSHDRWIAKDDREIMHSASCNKQLIIACHYAMAVWPRSHYGSWHVFGHSHGKRLPIGLSWDVGVDNNNFYPVSFEQLKDRIERLKLGGQKDD